MSESDAVQESKTPVVPEFSLKLKEIPVTLRTVEGLARPCVIRQLTGEGRDQFNEFQKQRFTKEADGSTKILNYVDLNHWLIAKMLWDVTTQKLIPITEIRQFPDEVIDGLYSICLNIEEYGKTGTEKAKND